MPKKESEIDPKLQKRKDAALKQIAAQKKQAAELKKQLAADAKKLQQLS